MSRDRSPWWLPFASAIGGGLVRLLGATWRLEVVDAPEYTRALQSGERFLYAFWHCGILPLAYTRRGEGIAVLVSRHRDGELTTRIIEGLGYVTARGSSTRGGEAGAREMLTWAQSGRHLAVTPDGPRGPRERAKEGAVFLADRAGLRVVPITLGVRSTWVLRSWDGFRVPKPFARVRVSHGVPMRLAIDGEGGLERARAELEVALTEQTARTRSVAGESA